MAALLIVTFDVTDPELFATYSPGRLPEIMETIVKHGGKPVAAGPTDAVEGTPAQTTVCLMFPEADAARAWLADDQYAPLKAIRYEATTNITEYIIPSVD